MITRICTKERLFQILGGAPPSQHISQLVSIEIFQVSEMEISDLWDLLLFFFY